MGPIFLLESPSVFCLPRSCIYSVDLDHLLIDVTVLSFDCYQRGYEDDQGGRSFFPPPAHQNTYMQDPFCLLYMSVKLAKIDLEGLAL